MLHSTTLSKIEALVTNSIKTKCKYWLSLLKTGHLRQFELELFDTLNEMYDSICSELLRFSALECADRLIHEAKLSGGRKIVERPVCIRLATGTQIKLDSPYVREAGEQWIGSRHLLSKFWNIIGGCSPLLNDRVGYCTALGPSYDMARQTLKNLASKCP